MRTRFCFLLSAASFTIQAQQWTQMSDVPTGTVPGRLAPVSFVIVDRIFVGGGAHYKDLWEYDLTTDTWIQKADIPGVITSRSFGVSFSLAGKGYVGLGIDAFPNDPVELNDLWQYDPLTDSWTQKADLPALPRSGTCSFTVNEKVYVVGGAENVATATVFEYDPLTDSWSQKSDYPAGPIYNPMSFTIDGVPYVTGGSIEEVPDVTPTTATFAYEPLTDTWIPKAPFAGIPRESGIAFGVNSKGYVGLGAPPTYAGFHLDMYVYDPALDQWSLLEPAWPAAPRAFGVSAVVNGIAYVGAGWRWIGSDIYYDEWFKFGSTTSVPEASSVDTPFNVWVDRANSQLNIRPDDITAPYSFSIMNAQGSLVGSGSSIGVTIWGYTSASGVYICRIKNEERTWTIRFVMD